MGGKTQVESCSAEAMGLSPLEAELLAGHQQGRTSLFEALETREPMVRLRDLLEADQPEMCLTDHGLSSSLRRAPYNLLIFLRVVTARGVNMTSGVSFAFRAERKGELFRAYEARMKTVLPADRAERRYVFFSKNISSLARTKSTKT